MDIDTVGTGVRRQPLLGAARGRAIMGQAIGDVGDQFHALAQDVQRARNAGTAADIDLKLRTARQSFLEGLRNAPDEQTWGERAQETADRTMQAINEAHPSLAPELKPQIKQAFDSWQSSLQIETQSMAHTQAINRAWGSIKEDYEEKLKDGQAQDALATLRVARAAQIADPVEIDRMERDIPKAIAVNFIENGLAANPKKTLELLDSGAALPAVDQNGKPITPKDVLGTTEMRRLKTVAHERVSRWQGDNFNAMLTDDIQGDYVPDDIIQTKIDTGEINPRAGLNLIRTQKSRLDAQSNQDKAAAREEARTIAKVDDDKRALIYSAIGNTDAWTVKPEDYRAELIADAAEISNPAVRQQTINYANRQYEAVKKSGKLEMKPVEKAVLDMMEEDRRNAAFVPVTTDVKSGKSMFFRDKPDKITHELIEGGIKGIEKMDPEDIEKRFGKGATVDTIRQAEQLYFAKAQQKMRDWFNDPVNANATLEQANKYRLELEKPLVMAQVSAALAPKSAVTKAPKAKDRVRQGGVTYEFDGKEWKAVK